MGLSKNPPSLEQTNRKNKILKEDTHRIRLRHDNHYL